MKGCGLIFLIFVILGLIFTVFSNDSTFTDINGQPYDARPIALSILLIALAGACIPYLLKIIKQNKQEKNRDNFRDLFFTTLEKKDFDSKNKITLRIPKSIGLAVDNNMERIAIFQETGLIIYRKDDILSSNIVHISVAAGSSLHS